MFTRIQHIFGVFRSGGRHCVWNLNYLLPGTPVRLGCSMIPLRPIITFRWFLFIVIASVLYSETFHETLVDSQCILGILNGMCECEWKLNLWSLEFTVLQENLRWLQRFWCRRHTRHTHWHGFRSSHQTRKLIKRPHHQSPFIPLMASKYQP